MAIAAVGIALLSLGVALLLAVQLRRAERQLAPLRAAVEGIELESDRLRTVVSIPPGVPINLDIPVDERVTVSVDTVLPINTRITVPIRSVLGSYDVPVPIRAEVPVRTDLSLRIRHTFRLRTRTPEGLSVPIEVGQ